MFKNYKEQLPNNLKRWGAKNELLKQITESPPILYMFLLKPFFLSIQPSHLKEHGIRLQFGLNYAKNNSMIKLKFFKKILLL